MSTENMLVAKAALTSGDVSGPELRAIATAFPALLPEVVEHPAADADLLAWAKQVGGSSVRREASRRLDELAAPVEPGEVGEQPAELGDQIAGVGGQPTEVGDQPAQVAEQAPELGDQPVDVIGPPVPAGRQPTELGEPAAELGDQPAQVVEPGAGAGDQLAESVERPAGVAEQPGPWAEIESAGPAAAAGEPVVAALAPDVSSLAGSSLVVPGVAESSPVVAEVAEAAPAAPEPWYLALPMPKVWPATSLMPPIRTPPPLPPMGSLADMSGTGPLPPGLAPVGSDFAGITVSPRFDDDLPVEEPPLTPAEVWATRPVTSTPAGAGVFQPTPVGPPASPALVAQPGPTAAWQPGLVEAAPGWVGANQPGLSGSVPSGPVGLGQPGPGPAVPPGAVGPVPLGPADPVGTVPSGPAGPVPVGAVGVAPLSSADVVQLGRMGVAQPALTGTVQPGPMGSAPSGPVGTVQPGPMGSAQPGPMGSAQPGPVGSAQPGPMGSAQPGPMGSAQPGPVETVPPGPAGVIPSGPAVFVPSAPTGPVISAVPSAPAEPYRDEPKRGRLGFIITIIIVALLLVGAVVFVVWRANLAARPEPSPGATPTSWVSSQPPAPAATGQPANPILVLDPAPVGQITDLVAPAESDTTALTPVTLTVDDGSSIDAVQAFADDLAAGRVDQIAQQCWMWPESEIMAFFGTADLRQTALTVLASTGVPGLDEVVWNDGDNSLSFSQAAIQSSYACPDSPLANRPTPAQATLIFTRLADRASGQPLDPGDTESAYPLLCQEVCTSWNLHGATAPPITTSLSSGQLAGLTALAGAPLRVDVLLVKGVKYERVTASDGSTTAVAYFYDGPAGPVLGEVDS